jgi:hypothetical protein
MEERPRCLPRLQSNKEEQRSIMDDQDHQHHLLRMVEALEDNHGRDINTKHQATTRQAIRELTQLYHAHKDTAAQNLQWLFDMPLGTQMQWRTFIILQWISTWKPILEKSYTTALETG